MFRVESLEPRLAPARVLFAASGGSIYERVGGAWEWRQKAFESDVPALLSTDGERVAVGAGPGGAPRVVTYDRGWQVESSVFVGDPSSRTGVSLVGFDRPSLGLRSSDPTVQSYLDRVPPLAVDTSRVSVTVDPAGTDYSLSVPVVGAARGYYRSADQSIHIRADYPALVLHEVGHWVGDVVYGDLSEEFAWRFSRWVNGDPDAGLDLLRLDDIGGPFGGGRHE